MKIAVIDYGAGNLKSVYKALVFLGEDVCVTDDPQTICNCGAILLPGVGAFPDAARSLNARGLFPLLREEAKKKPFLGICLGMQMLFEKGFEFEECDGLGLIPGTVEKLKFGSGLKIPHMGWNQLQIVNPCPLTEGLSGGEFVYFVHSYGAKTEKENIAALSEYGQPVTAAVCRENVFGTQFHPEKSGEIGLKMLKNFCDYAKKN